MENLTFREAASSAIRFWERMRLVYNAVLVAIVLVCFVVRYPESRKALNVQLGLFILVLAVLANVAYCGGYIPDVFAQMAGYESAARKLRWTLFSIGLLCAGILTYFWFWAVFYNVND